MTPEQAQATQVVESDVVTGEDTLKSWTWFGYKAADAVATRGSAALSRVSPMPRNAIADADYLRAALGNAWLVFPLIGFAMGIVAIVNSKGLPLPPATAIFLIIVVLGCFDASAGLVATTVFLAGTVVTGHFDSLHAVAGIFGLGAMWFGAAKLAHEFRILRTWDTEPTAALRNWRIAGDIIILPIAGAFFIGKLAEVFPYLTGLRVPIAKDSNLIIVVSFIALMVRAMLQSAVIHNYRNRLAEVQTPKQVTRWPVAFVVSFFVRAFVAYAVIWSFLGNTVQTWIVLLLFVSFEPIGYLGHLYGPENEVIHRFVPKNLLKLTVIILFAELLILWLSPKYHSVQQLTGWTFVWLGVFVVALLILEQFRGTDWPERWAFRILGALSIVFFVLVIQGYVKIT